MFGSSALMSFFSVLQSHERLRCFNTFFILLFYGREGFCFFILLFFYCQFVYFIELCLQAFFSPFFLPVCPKVCTFLSVCLPTWLVEAASSPRLLSAFAAGSNINCKRHPLGTYFSPLHLCPPASFFPYLRFPPWMPPNLCLIGYFLGSLTYRSPATYSSSRDQCTVWMSPRELSTA